MPSTFQWEHLNCWSLCHRDSAKTHNPIREHLWRGEVSTNVFTLKGPEGRNPFNRNVCNVVTGLEWTRLYLHQWTTVKTTFKSTVHCSAVSLLPHTATQYSSLTDLIPFIIWRRQLVSRCTYCTRVERRNNKDGDACNWSNQWITWCGSTCYDEQCVRAATACWMEV